jgi:hypothetical protein
VDLLCSNYGSSIADLLVAPFTIAYYAYSAYTRAGWHGPTGMFAFFLVIYNLLNYIYFTLHLEIYLRF